MMQCPPPMPGNGINITVSIDLGAMLGGGGKPPCHPHPEEEENKLTYFNEANRPKPKSLMDGAIDGVCGKYGGKKPEDQGMSRGKSFPGGEDEKNKEEDED